MHTSRVCLQPGVTNVIKSAITCFIVPAFNASCADSKDTTRQIAQIFLHPPVPTLTSLPTTTIFISSRLSTINHLLHHGQHHSLLLLLQNHHPHHPRHWNPYLCYPLGRL